MAGTWTNQKLRRGYIDNLVNAPQAILKTYTADASGDIDDGTFELIGGQIVAMDVEFDTTDTPTSAAVTIKTAAGITLISSGTLNASGRTYPDYALTPVVGNVTVAVTNVGNSKVATIVLYMV